ncbi:MAG: DUF4384 domain-containing protein [Spirochaetes bacterium]|nr:DUF4384 domain-containing protein [Spirochaetota bacterium]
MSLLKSKIIPIFIIVLIILFINAKNDKPQWVDVTPKSDDLIFGIGGPSKDINNSVSLAYQMIARFIGVEVKSVLTKNKEISTSLNYGKAFFKKDIETDLTEEFNQSISENSSANLYGALIKERWQNKKTKEWWVLVEMPKSSIEKMIKEKTIFIDNLVTTFKGFSEKNNFVNKTIVIGNFSIKDKNSSSEFSNFLESISTSIIVENRFFAMYDKSKFLDELNKNKLNTNIVSYNNTRGLNVLGKNILEIKTNKININGIINGEYWVQDENTSLIFYLIDFDTSKILDSKRFDIPNKRLPQGIKLEPDNIRDIEKINMQLNLTSSGSEKQILEVWTNRGEGGIYKEKEKMIINVRSNIDCYIKIYHRTASGIVTMVFPNKFDKNNFLTNNKTYRIGDDKYAFDFEITPPFGTEIITVTSKKSQFSDLQNEIFNNIVRQFDKSKDITIIIKEDNPEQTANCSYTVIK